MSDSTSDSAVPDRRESEAAANNTSLDQESSFATYLHLLETEQIAITDLITPLVYACGNGLPQQIWRPLAVALSGRTHADHDVDWLLSRSDGFLTAAREEDRQVYRLSSPEIGKHVVQRNTRSAQDTQTLICQTLRDLTPALDGTARKDWRAADPYIRHHIIEHAAASGSVDTLTTDLLYLAVADPPRMIKAMRAAEVKHATHSIYRLCSQYLRSGCYEDNLSQFQLTAYAAGESSLAKSVDQEPMGRIWSVCWCHQRHEWPHHVLGRHLQESWRPGGIGVNSVDVVNLDGRAIAVTCGYDGEVRMWDIDANVPIGDPSIFTGALRSQPMRVAVCRHTNRTFLILLTALGDILGWEWHGSFKELGTIAHVGHIDVVDQMVVTSTRDQSWIAACGGRLKFFRWDAAGCVGQSIEGLDRPTAAAFGTIAGGDVVVAAASSQAMAAFRLNGETMWRKNAGHERITSVETYSSGNGIAIFGTNDGKIVSRDLETGELTNNPTLAHRGAVTCLTATKQGSASVLVSGGGDCLIRLWNLPDLTPMGGALRGHNARLNALKVLPVSRAGGSQIISASADATLRMWDMPEGFQVPVVRRPPEPIMGVTLGEIGGIQAAITLTRTGGVEFWECETGSALNYNELVVPFDDDDPPVNRVAAGLWSGESRVAIAPTHDVVVVWNPITGEVERLTRPSKSPIPHPSPLPPFLPLPFSLPPSSVSPSEPVELWCACLGTVRGRLARVAYRDQPHGGFAQVFQLDTGQPLSVPIEAESPLNTLRLGEIGGEPVIISRNFDRLLFVAQLSDGTIVGSPFNLGDPFSFPVIVGDLHNKQIAVAAFKERTKITVTSICSGAQSISIDLGAKVHGLAIHASGIIIGTTKGLAKLDISPEYL